MLGGAELSILRISPLHVVDRRLSLAELSSLRRSWTRRSLLNLCVHGTLVIGPPGHSSAMDWSAVASASCCRHRSDLQHLHPCSTLSILVHPSCSRLTRLEGDRLEPQADELVHVCQAERVRSTPVSCPLGTTASVSLGSCQCHRAMSVLAMCCTRTYVTYSNGTRHTRAAGNRLSMDGIWRISAVLITYKINEVCRFIATVTSTTRSRY